MITVEAPATFRVQLIMTIRPGMEQEFEQVWCSVGDAVTSHPANRGQWLSRSLDADGEPRYLIVSDWTDEPSFREFETSGRHLQHRQRLHPFRSGGTMETMTIVAAMGAEPGGHADHRTWEARSPAVAP